MTLLRPLFGLVLAIVLALTSVTMAVARGQVPMGGTIEICAGDSTVLVTLDANGQPVAPHHHCPDCLTGVAALDTTAMVTSLLLSIGARAPFLAISVTSPTLPQPQATARGPPSLI